MQDQNQPKNQTGASDATVSQIPLNQVPQSVAKNKEGEPVGLQVEISPAPTPEVKIPDELSHVIEKGTDGEEFKLSKEVSASLATPAKEPMSEIRTPTGVFSVPMTYAQALIKKKMTKFTQSSHWLAAVIMYLWRKYDPDAVSDNKKSYK